jgi:Bacterial Ig-like domain
MHRLQMLWQTTFAVAQRTVRSTKFERSVIRTLQNLKEMVMQSKLYLSSRKNLKWLFSLCALFFIPLLLAGKCGDDLPLPIVVKITSFTASPASLPIEGGNITLTWSTEGATTLSIDQGVGLVTGASVVVNNITATKTFTLTASNGTEKVNAKTTVEVAKPGDKDTTPPTIVSLTPANGSKDVPSKTPAVVVFSEAIKADTVTDSSVKVSAKDGSVLDKTLELSSDGKTLTIIPFNAIEPPNTLTIGLEATITDLAGNTLQTSPWSFEIPFWLTLSNALDVTPDNFAFQPSIAVSANGNLAVAWYEQDPVTNQTRVYVKEWNGTTWQQLGDALNTTSTNSASNPSLVVDSQNRPSVAFQENDSVTGDSSVYVKRWNGSTWITVGAAVATGSAEHPSLAIGKDVLGVAYTNINGTNQAVYFKLLNGVVWEQLGTELNDVKTQNADYPSLALYESQGLGELVPFIAFQEFDGTSNNIYVKQWSEMAKDWLKLDDELDVAVAKEAQHPSLRLNGNFPTVAWQEEGSTNKDIYVKEFNGSTWDALGNDDFKTQDSSEAFIATHRDGFSAPALVWRGSDGNGQNVYAKVFDETSSGWSPLPPTGLEPFNTPSKAAEHPEMTFGGFDVYVAFAEFDSTANSTNLVMKRYNIAAPEPQ